MERPQP